MSSLTFALIPSPFQVLNAVEAEATERVSAAGWEEVRADKPEAPGNNGNNKDNSTMGPNNNRGRDRTRGHSSSTVPGSMMFPPARGRSA